MQHRVVRFEFDPGKSASNLAKHGIDFADAKALWDDEDHLEVPARTQDEPRWVVIGRIDGRVWTASSRGGKARRGSSRSVEHDHLRRRCMKATELDAVFDENATDIIEHLDLDAARRPRRDAQRVNVDFPAWMVASLDAEATRFGITRQAVIKTWIAERLDRQAS